MRAVWASAGTPRRVWRRECGLLRARHTRSTMVHASAGPSAVTIHHGASRTMAGPGTEATRSLRRRGDGTGPGYAEKGDRLRAGRLARGLSVRGLAERLDVSPSLISQVETGRARPSVNTLY